mgnify:CR=1 FL=1
MKKNVVVAMAVGVRMTELGAIELAIKDPDDRIHTVAFHPSTARGLRELWLKNEPFPVDQWTVDSIGTPAIKTLKRVAALERSQSAGWSVQALPTEQTVALAVRDPDGAATLTLLDAAQTQRLVETLQQALALLNPASGTAH